MRGNNNIRFYLKKMLFVVSIYKKYRRLSDHEYNKKEKVREWVIKNMKFISKFGLTPFIFTEDTAYIIIKDLKIRYLPEVYNGGILGLYFNNIIEKNELQLVKRNFYDGQVFLDIGANFGWYSLNIAKSYPSSVIHAFEPVSSTFSILKSNVKINKFEKQIICNKYAVSDSCSDLRIISEKYSAANSIIRYKNNIYNAPTESVRAITIDRYAQDSNLRRLDFIKCDIEGAELFMLRGAIKSIDGFKPHILLEIEDRWTRHLGYSPFDILNFLIKRGYKYYRITYDKQVLPSGDFENDLTEGNNFLFYHNSKQLLL